MKKAITVNHNKQQKMCYRNGWKMLKKTSNLLPYLIIYMCLTNSLVQALLTNDHNSLDESLISAEQNNTSHRQGRCKSMNIIS